MEYLESVKLKKCVQEFFFFDQTKTWIQPMKSKLILMTCVKKREEKT
jgi:hypothetical protein